MKRYLKCCLNVGLVVGGLSAARTVRAEDPATTPAPTTAPAAVPSSTVEERLAILERKYENDQEAAATKAKDGFGVTANVKDGFQIKSNDGDFALRIGGILQGDYRDYLGDHNTAPQITDTFLLRRIRLNLAGTLYKFLDFRLVSDFANGGGTTAGPTSSLLPDAYIEYRARPWAKIRFGKSKSPVGLEVLQSDPATLFVERGLPANLVPNRDTGVQLSGDVASGAISYQAAILNGVADGASGETDTSDDKEYIGRLWLTPFKALSSDWINGLSAGVAGSIGNQFGSAATSNLTGGYRTDGQQTFFTYQSGTFSNGQRKRIAPQAAWYNGSLGVFWEYVASSQELRRVNVSTRTATITNRSWQIAGSYVLTGERASYNGVKPRKVFDPKNGGWGALEVAGRYGIFRADDQAFANAGFFSSTTSSARKARSWTAGLNWYFNNALRLTSDYDVTSFAGGAAGGKNRPTEKLVISRLQLQF